MSGMVINQIDNANVYINGNSFLGKAKSVKLPEFDVEMVEHKNLGLVGTIKLPTGVNALEGEIVWDGFYPEVAALANNPYKAAQLMVRADVSVYNAAGRAAEVPLVMLLNCNFNKVPLGEYKPKEAAEFSMTYQATMIKQSIDGKEVLYFDAFTNKWRVAGQDVLETYRKNVGQ
ncbi:phage major tail tube protein [Pasteurellaceae bacterium RH1A]|nr:phage major tail tube protein [Pasteurellaceae bacterium RH1A]